MKIQSISVSDNKKNIINKNSNLSFRSKTDGEYFMKLAEKSISENIEADNCLFEAFRGTITGLSRVYKHRETNRPSQFKSSFFVPHGHISVAFNSPTDILVARETEHTADKDVERLISYENHEGNLIKNIYSEYKNKQGQPLGNPKLKQWQFDKEKKEFSCLG